MSGRAAVGDLIAIPALGKWALAKVLFVSRHFKNIMLISLMSELLGDPDDLPDGLRHLESGVTFYTASVGFGKRGWRVVGSSDVSSEEVHKSLRIVAGEVWVRDELLRQASPDDEKVIRTMGVDGFIRVERQISSFFEEKVPGVRQAKPG
jgi:hypothetical protein